MRLFTRIALAGGLIVLGLASPVMAAGADDDSLVVLTMSYPRGFDPGPAPQGGRPPDATPFPVIRDWSTVVIGVKRDCDGEVYEIKIRGDGVVGFHGEWAAIRGNHRSLIPDRAARDLVERFRAAEFLRSWPAYGLPASAKPAGGCALITTISLGIAGQNWQVVGRAIGAGAPEGMPPELVALAQAIEAAAGPWLTPSAATIDALQAEGYFRGKQDGPSVLDSMISVGADIGLIRRLIALGARLDAPENPLATASGRVDPEIVAALLAAGGNRFPPSQLDAALALAANTRWGMGPYDHTPEQPDQRRRRVAVIEALIQAGANPSACTVEGIRCTSLAAGGTR